MKIFINRSQESLRKNSWGPIAMLWLALVARGASQEIILNENSIKISSYL
jgi:hypothetical protein